MISAKEVSWFIQDRQTYKQTNRHVKRKSKHGEINSWIKWWRYRHSPDFSFIFSCLKVFITKGGRKGKFRPLQMAFWHFHECRIFWFDIQNCLLHVSLHASKHCESTAGWLEAPRCARQPPTLKMLTAHKRNEIWQGEEVTYSQESNNAMVQRCVYRKTGPGKALWKTWHLHRFFQDGQKVDTWTIRGRHQATGVGKSEGA